MSISLARFSSLNLQSWYRFINPSRQKRAERLTPVLGIDLGTTAVKAVAIIPARQRLHLAGYAIVERKTNAGDTNLQQSDALRKASQQIGLRGEIDQAATVIADTQVLTETFTVPAHLDHRAIEARIALRIETALNKTPAELCYDYRCETSVQDDERTILLVTARQEAIDACRQPLQDAGLRCRLIDLESHAIARLFGQTVSVGSTEAVAVVDLGSQLRLTVIHAHRVIFQHTVTQTLSDGLEPLVAATTRALALYQGYEEAQPLKAIWLIGGYSNNKLAARLSSQLGMEVRCLADVITVESAGEIDLTRWQAALPRLITALGAALHLGDPHAHWH